MTREQWLKAYNKLNNSYKRTMIFRIGAEAGFFSEYNNMVLALLYCLKYKIKFVIYSKDANFSLEKGWNDFFESFGAEASGEYNTIYNLRPYQIVQTPKRNYLTKFYKLISGANYFTQDLWDFHRNSKFSEEIFDLPSLGMHNASILDATQIIIKNIWVYSSQSRIIIEKLKLNIHLKDNYVGMHIRSGDKFLESELFNIDQYISAASELRNIKDAFVLTDDYTVIEMLKDKYPEWNFQTLCDESERGYFHHEFIKLTKLQKYEQHLNLFASMDICAGANKFIGTYSSNPGMYMGMRIGEEKCKCLDYDSWLIW